MSKKSFNLVYSTQSNNSFNFFQNLKKMNEVVLGFKVDHVINDFGAADEKEIGRGESYAVFPELIEMVQNEQIITLETFRNSLSTRGVTDTTFQNKILSLVLQNKAGLQYALGNVLNGLLLENQHNFLMKPNYNLILEVHDKNNIKMKFTGNWHNLNTYSDVPDLSANISVDITPNKVTIESFQVTQLSDTPETRNAFAFLEANQVNLLEKIFIFLKNLFGLNADIEIENVSRDNVPWYLNANKIKSDDANGALMTELSDSEIQLDNEETFPQLS